MRLFLSGIVGGGGQGQIHGVETKEGSAEDTRHNIERPL